MRDPDLPQDVAAFNELRKCIGNYNEMDTVGTSKKVQAAEVNAAIMSLKQYIYKDIPTGSPDPANLKALYWAIGQLGTSWGYLGVPPKTYVKGFEPTSDSNRCNYFVASAYIYGAGVTNWPGARSWLFHWGEMRLLPANVVAGSGSIAHLNIASTPESGSIVAYHNPTFGDSGHETLYVGGSLEIYAGGIGIAKLGDRSSIMAGHDYLTIRNYAP